MSQLTRKQFTILDIIVQGNEAGVNPLDRFVDLDQVIERIPYEVTKAAIQFSIRSMVEAKFIEKHAKQKRRGANRILFAATEVGLYRMKPESFTSAPSFISDFDENEDIGDFHSEGF